MHESSMVEMKKFVDHYLYERESLRILDLGSLDWDRGGNYRKLFEGKGDYIGADIKGGPNVDTVLENPYTFNFPSGSFDVVVSGQCLEHVEDLHSWIKEAARVLKPKGIMCLIVPTSWPEHRLPVDCWRILPDGMRFLLEKIAGLEVVDIYVNRALGDCVGVAQKPGYKKTKKNEKIKLNLGCGLKKLDGYINIDNRSIVEPDELWDLRRGLWYDDNSVDEIRAFDILEHLEMPKAVNLLREIHRVLKPNGELIIFVPSTDGRGAFQDPTHVSFWNLNTWLYFVEESWHQLYPELPMFEAIELGEINTSEELKISHVGGRLRPKK